MFYRFEALKSRRQKLSNYLLFCFILTVALAGAFSEFFQTPLKLDGNLEPWQQFFTPRQLASVQKVELSNKLGTFHFQKEEKGGWNMIHPRKLKADGNTMAKIFAEIQQIKILKLYPKDSINLSHYSLDKPASTLKLIDADNKKVVLKTGLVNPIDNSTYMTLSDKAPLFHIEKINFPLESLNLSNFIDSTIFSLSLSEISKIQIYRGPRLNLSARRQDNQWLSDRNKVFNKDRIQAFLEKMLSLRSLLILDETNKKLEKAIGRYTRRPFYTIKIQNREKQTRTYKITYPLSKLADIKIEKGQNSLITKSDGSHPLLIDKEHLAVFNVKESRLYQKSPH